LAEIREKPKAGRKKKGSLSGHGYATPQDGQKDLGGNFTTFVLWTDGKWWSVKDVSGLDRTRNTTLHEKALREKGHLEIRKLKRSQSAAVGTAR
jgi:hypothetical protein